MPSSSLTTPSAVVTGAICPANRPSAWAAAAFSCEPSRVLVQLGAREAPALGHHLGADALVGPRAVVAGREARPERVGARRPRSPSAPGTSTRRRRRPPRRTGPRPARPPRSAPTAGWSRTAGRASCRGPSPASRRRARALRAMFQDCSPTWDTQPQTTSSTTPGSIPDRLGQRLQHVRGQVDRVHPGQAAVALPTGVRTASTMTASRIRVRIGLRPDATGGTVTDDEVLTERDGAILVITLNRPKARNAVNAALARGLAAAVDDLDARSRAVGRRAHRRRRLVLLGHGPEGVPPG